MEKVCLECEALIQGRSDKKFCHDICRTAYHNRLAKDHLLQLRAINRKLRENRKILSVLYQSGSLQVRRTQLFRLGFDFNFLTHAAYVEGKGYCRFCYEYGYFPKGDVDFALVEMPVNTYGMKLH
jgi:hypothetical protein